MKKIFAILLTLVMVISMFTGCDIPHTHAELDTEPAAIADNTTAVTDSVVDETEATVETTVPETETPTEATTEAPTEANGERKHNKDEKCKHDYKSKTVKPTCTNAGHTEKTCAKCGNVVKTDEVKATGHDYTSKMTTAATCTTDGVKTYTCKNCNHAYTESITGTHDYECTDTRPATCSNTGDKTYTCKTCGNSYKETLPKNEHVWTEWVITREPTTTTYGKKVRTCELCNGAQEVSIDPLPADETEPVHQHSYSSKVTKAATCAEEGVKTFTCSCGESYTETIAKTGHNWGGWVVTKAPTTSAEGVETRTCSVCKATETRAVDKLPEDDSSNTVVDCEANGLRHTMSAADHAKITRGDNFYDIKCICGRHCRGNNRDAALTKFNAHVAEKLYDYCGEILREYEGHYHNCPSTTVVCTTCGKTVTYNDCYWNCGGNTDECAYD